MALIPSLGDALYNSLTVGTLNATTIQSNGVTATTLLYSNGVQLATSFSSVTNTLEQVIGNLLVALPIINKTCTVKTTIQFYTGFGTGNNNVSSTIGINSTGIGSGALANVYASGSQSNFVYSNSSISTVNLSVQQYAAMTIRNDASTSINFSSNVFRTALLIEIYG